MTRKSQGTGGKVLKVIGIIAIAFLIFFFGVAVGNTPSTEQQTAQTQQQQASNDLVVVAGQYQTLYSLCEQKYQTAINGDYATAVRINGQMDAIIAQIDAILSKYNSKLKPL